MFILYKGLEVEVEIESYDPGCPPILRADPNDCYEGDPEEAEFQVVGVSIDCPETFIESIDGSSLTLDNDDFYELVLAAIREAREDV